MGGMAVIRTIRIGGRRRGAAPPLTVLLLDRGADAFIAGRAGADAWPPQAVRRPGLRVRSLLDGLVVRRRRRRR